ncbi:MAG TPA: MlaD family protein [Janthinobacterium sp.]|jgi:paraquat-inducible protein B|nr:MlaD family protein [Janthinobacterium sp.]
MSENEGGNPTPLAPAPLPEPDVDQSSHWLPSLVWLIPLLAALVGVALVAKSLLDQGPTVTVTFLTGEGLEPGKTKVKYKDVEIGVVKTIKLDHDLSKVRVTIDMSKDAERFTAKDTRFWVVRPHVGASGVSGLSTLLSGAYIGVDAGRADDNASEFTGLENTPAVTGDQKGRLYTLHTGSLGSIDVGTPVYYRRIKVGQVVAFALDQTGNGISVTAFVDEPYQRYVGKNTRWWHASGVDLRVDSSGFKLNTQSLAALVTGGIAFGSDTGQAPDTAAPAGSSFNLAPDRASAMRDPDGPAITTVFYFDQSLRGLSPGATVDFRGIVLGEVHSVGVEFDPVKKSFRMPVTVELYPGRLGRAFQKSIAQQENSSHDMLERMVSHGLRAQLRNGNLLTGQLYVALDFFPNAAPAKLDLSQNPIEVPTVPNSLDELQNQVASIARKLDKMPFEEIGANLNTSLKSANALFKKLDGEVVPEMTDTLGAARKTFGSAERVLQQDSPLQSDLRQALQQLNLTLQSLNALSDYLERHPESLIRGKKGEQK